MASQIFLRIQNGVLITLFCLMGLVSFSQNPAFLAFDKEEIIPSKQVYDLFLDNHGYVWIGHQKGITRYSGYNVKYFTHPLMQSFELTNIVQDSNGTIWCTNFVGQIFYIKNDTINLLPHTRKFNFFNRAGLSFGDSTIYFVENNKIYTINTNTFHIYKHIVSNIGNIISYCYLPKLGFLVYTTKGFYVYRNKKLSAYKKVFNLGLDIIFIKNIDNQIYGIDRAFRTVYLFKNNTWTPFVNTDITNSDITTFTKIKNQFFVNTYNGYLTTRLNSSGLRNYFKTYAISDQIKDNEGNTWISTLYNGLLIVPEDNNLKQILPFNENITAMCLIPDKDQIALGTKNGKIFIVNKNNLNIVRQINLSEIKNIENIYYNAKDNELNVSTLKHSIISLFDYSIRETELIHNAKSILAYQNQYIFASSLLLSVVNKNGSNILPKDAKWPTLGPVQILPNRFDIIENERFYKLVYCQKSNLFFAASVSNVFYFNNQFIDTLTYHGKPISARNMIIHDNKIYASQINKGLFIITDTSRITLIDTLPLRTISNFCLSGNKIIANCSEGLFSYDINTQKLENISKKYNFPTQSFELLAGDQHFIYASEGNSIIKINNYFKKHHSYKIPIAITNILVNGAKVNSLVNLRHAQNNIVVYFDIISYKLPKNVMVKYRLNEQDNWKEIKALQGFISLNILPPGNYNLQIELANYEAKNTIEIPITINPPYYKTWWFIVAIILVTSGLVLIVMLYRIRAIKLQNKLHLEKVILEKDLRQSLLASIRAQMNPHFIFNALNTIHSFIYTNDKKNASEYLVKFSELTRLILEMSEKELVTLKEEIQSLELYLSLENVRFNNLLDYNFIIDSSIVKEYLRMPPMLIQPYVENAIKHGLLHKKGEKKLFIYFTLTQHMLTITIEDNGVGRAKSYEINKNRSKSHYSFSTSANKKRIQILNESNNNVQTGVETIDLYNENQEPIGTRVIIEIPLILS